MAEKKDAILIEFDDSELSKKRFATLYNAWRVVFAKYSKGEGLRVVNRIGDKLESISDSAPTSRDEFARVLRPGNWQLTLVGLEGPKLRAILNDEEISWTHLMGRDAEETQDWAKTWKPTDVEAKPSAT